MAVSGAQTTRGAMVIGEAFDWGGAAAAGYKRGVPEVEDITDKWGPPGELLVPAVGEGERGARHGSKDISRAHADFRQRVSPT